MSSYVFCPRKDNKDMRPEFYDHSWTPQPYGGYGPSMANPYNQNSSNPLIRMSNYFFGRWYETLEYYFIRVDPLSAWWQVDDPGSVTEYHNNVSYSTDYLDFTYWYRASIHNHYNPLIGMITYENDDNLQRYVTPSSIGEFVLFYDANQNIEFGGIIEAYRDANDYDISYLDTTGQIYPNPEPVRYLTITNNRYQNVIGNSIGSYYSLFQDPKELFIGHTIGYKRKTILYAKRYNDIRKGNDL